MKASTQKDVFAIPRLHNHLSILLTTVYTLIKSDVLHNAALRLFTGKSTDAAFAISNAYANSGNTCIILNQNWYTTDSGFKPYKHFLKGTINKTPGFSKPGKF